MKSAILYAGFRRQSARQQLVLALDGTRIFIRVEIKKGMSAELAHSEAKERKGEILLNTVELPE